jgi:hypothetical protein
MDGCGRDVFKAEHQELPDGDRTRDSRSPEANVFQISPRIPIVLIYTAALGNGI